MALLALEPRLVQKWGVSSSKRGFPSHLHGFERVVAKQFVYGPSQKLLRTMPHASDAECTNPQRIWMVGSMSGHSCKVQYATKLVAPEVRHAFVDALYHNIQNIAHGYVWAILSSMKLELIFRMTDSDGGTSYKAAGTEREHEFLQGTTCFL